MKTPSKKDKNALGDFLPECTQAQFQGLRSSYIQAISDQEIEFTDDDKKSFIELAKTLKQVHVRLLMEGYIIEQGRIYKP